jgi:HAD superfamily hydrolase (TIGR01458 family)
MIRGILLDLSGVLYTGDEPIQGATHAIEKLSETKLPVRYITNTTRSPRQSIIERLDRMGFNIETDDVFTAPIVAKHYLSSHNLNPYLLIHPNLEVEFAEFKVNKPNSVLVGDAAEGFSYEHMNNAFRLLLDGAPLYAMGINRYFKEGEQFSLDAGPFVNALEYASDTKATVIGKPAREFYLSAVESLGCTPEETVMVGDDVESDVIGAVAAGLQGILVRTGKYRSGDEENIENKANCVADINEAVNKILRAI